MLDQVKAEHNVVRSFVQGERGIAMEKAQELLQATSNVIELKAGHFYLLVFQGRVRSEDLSFLGKVLKANGMDSVSIALQEGDELQVIEVDQPKT